MWAPGGDGKAVDRSIDEAKKKIFADGTFTAGRDELKATLADEQSKLNARSMPRMNAVNATGTAAGTQGLGYQSGLASNLAALAAGGPSAGQQQLTAGNANAKQALYASAFSRPGAGVRGLRTTGNQASLMDAQTARQMEMLRAQEQQQAVSQLGQVGTAMRAGDMAEAAEWNKINAANAGYQQAADVANMDAALQWQQQNDAQRRALLAMGIDSAQAEWDNRLGRYGAEVEAAQGRMANERAQKQANWSRAAQGIGMVASVLSLASDERVKADVKPADSKLREFLGALGAHDYEYTDTKIPGTAPGRHVSPMAQEIERTEIGRAAVTDGPDGVKRVDYGRLLGAILAGEAHLHKRLERLERKGRR